MVKENYIIVNNIKFYYDPLELEIDEEVMNKLENFDNKEDDGYYECYEMYIDEIQGLVIF